MPSGQARAASSSSWYVEVGSGRISFVVMASSR
jgi:hypothetical protein